MILVIEGLSDDATDIGLTEGAVETAGHSRLRAARLYTDAKIEMSRSCLYVNVNVVGGAFSLSIEFKKAGGRRCHHGGCADHDVGWGPS